MNHGNPDWYRILTALEQGADCSDVLKMTVDCLNGGAESELLSATNDALTECAECDPDTSIEILEQLIQQRSQRQGLERGLEAIGECSINQVNSLLIDFLQNNHWPPTEFVPHLYRDREAMLGSQFHDWYKIDKWFFRDAASTVLQYALKVPPYAECAEDPFTVDEERIYQDIVNLANTVGVNSSNVNGFSEKTVIRGYHLIEDIVHHKSYDWNEIEANLCRYPSINRFLSPTNWKSTVQNHNRHPLIDNLQSTKYEHAHKQLSQIDYCLSFISLQNDRISSLRSNLLDRHQFGDTLSELHILAICRRHFGCDSIEIEAPISDSNKDTDLKVELENHNVRIEVTSPRQEDMLRIGGGMLRSYDSETNPARGPVTAKARNQLAAVKNNTDDICVIALQKRFFGVSESEAKDYVLGQEVVFIRDGRLWVDRTESEVLTDGSLKHVDYLITFGPRSQDTHLSDPSAALFVLQEESNAVTQQLQFAFNAEIHRHQP